MKKLKIDLELIKLLERRFPGLFGLVVTLGITYIDPKKSRDEETSIFIWGVKDRSYETNLNEYTKILVADGCLVEVVKDDETLIDVINAGKEYYYLYQMCIDKLPLGMLYSSVSDSENVLKINEARMAYIREVLMYLSDLDDKSVEAFRDKLRVSN